VTTENASRSGADDSTDTAVAAQEIPRIHCVDDASLPEGIADLIDADVARTFPSNQSFLAMDGQDRLRRVLRSITVADKEMGYCQSLNFIAAVFIMILRDEPVACSAVQRLLMKLGTRSWYSDGMRQLRADTAVLDDLVRERLPQLHETFRRLRFDLLFVSSKWFLCLFSTALEGEALYRVWDVMHVDGVEAVFRVALALLAQYSDAAAEAKTEDDLVFMFQEARRETRPNVLVDAAYNSELVGHISRADLSRRRQEALRKIDTQDTRSEMRNHHYRRGGVRPASILAHMAARS